MDSRAQAASVDDEVIQAAYWHRYGKTVHFQLANLDLAGMFYECRRR